MSRNQNFGEAIGLSRHEQSEIQGRALGAHMWGKLMEPFGGESGFKNAIHSETYDRIRQSGYGAEHIKMDAGDDHAPYVEHRSGPYRARWYGGTYADIHHVSDPETAIDTLNVGHEAHPDKGNDLQSRLHEWHQDQSQYYR